MINIVLFDNDSHTLHTHTLLESEHTLNTPILMQNTCNTFANPHLHTSLYVSPMHTLTRRMVPVMPIIKIVYFIQMKIIVFIHSLITFHLDPQSSWKCYSFIALTWIIKKIIYNTHLLEFSKKRELLIRKENN